VAGALLSWRLLPWPVAAALLLIINAAAGLLITKRIEFNNAPELYFPRTAPSVQLQDRLRAEFPTDELLVALFQGPNLYSADSLSRIDQLTQRLQRHSLVQRVFSVTNVDHIASTEDGFAVEPLIDLGRLAEATSEERQARVLGDRFVPGMLASRDGSALAVIVRPVLMGKSTERESVAAEVRAAVEDVGLAPQFIGLAGQVALDVAQFHSAIRETAVYVPMTTAIGLVLLWWVVGRWIPMVFGAIAISTVVGFAIAALVALGRPYTLVSVLVSPLLAAYTIATLLHLYAPLSRAHRAGLGPRARVLRAIREVHKAGLFNVLTTGAGLISLVLTPIPPIQDFGIVGAIGTAVVYLVVFHLVPPLLVRWDLKPWPRRGAGFRLTRGFAYGLARVGTRRAGVVLVIMAACVLVTLPILGRVAVESDLLKFFSESHELTRTTRLVEEKLSGVTSLEVVFDGQGRDSLKNVERLQAMKAFQTWVEALPQIDRAVSMTDLVEEMNWAFSGEDPSFRRLPDSDQALSQLLLIYDGRDLHELVNREFQTARIVLSVNVHGANQIGQVIDAIRARLNEQPIAGVTWDIGGFGRLFADQEDLLVIGQVNSFWGAFGQIFLILSVLWRSLTASVVTLLPNLAPLYFIFVLMGLTGIPLDMATVLIAGVVLGITVDDTIHLYHSYLRRRREGRGWVLALARSFEASGRAVVAISVLLVAQFALLTTSEFQPTADFGLLASVGLLAGQIFELLLLPALIVAWNRWKVARASAP
jgi:hypothetical protein